MIRAATYFSAHKDGAKAALEAVRGAMEKAGIAQADFVLYFASSQHRKKYSEILEIIASVAGTRNVLGTSAAGVLTEEIEIEGRPGLTILVVSAPAFRMDTFLIHGLQESNFKAGEELGRRLRQETGERQSITLLPDPFSFHAESFFDGFESMYGYTPLYGGLASEDGKENKTYQFCGSDVVFDAAAGFVMSGPLMHRAAVSRSCHPFGEPLKITRAEGNLIYEMDGHPAYDILLDSISNLPIDNTDQIFEHVFLGVPMKHFQTDFSSSPFLIRNILGVNAKKGMLACASPIEEGEYVTFAVRDPGLAKDNFEKTLRDLAMEFSGSAPAFGIYFNCASRGQALYGQAGEDTAKIRHYFPGVPIIGFFSYGEIAPIDHVNHVHYHSGVLSLFGANHPQA